MSTSNNSKTSGVAEKVSQTADQVKQSIPNYGIDDGSKKKPGSGDAHVGNKNRGVGGTDEEGGLSTADTVADGGPDGEPEDKEFKP